MKKQKNVIIGIYKIINPKGRTYIGQSINILKRWNSGYKNYNCKSQIKLYNSLNKYGPENHKFEIICECELDELDQLETLYKKWEFCKVNKKWSNVLFCGLYDNGGGPKNQETKNKISETLKNNNHSKYYTEEIKKKISEANKGKKGVNKGKKRSQEIRDKISKSNRGVTRNSKPVLQYDLEGNFIKEWENQTEISKLYGISQSCISDCCMGKSKTSLRYIWRYKINESIPLKIKKQKMNNRGNNIYQYDLDGHFIKEWESIKEIKKHHTGNIQSCLMGHLKTSGNYIWKYKINNK